MFYQITMFLQLLLYPSFHVIVLYLFKFEFQKIATSNFILEH
jgi:hypothetical protein